jgi:hypothetical protein
MDNPPPTDPNAALRWSIYSILMCVGLGAMVGRILAVDSIDFRRLADSHYKQQLQSELQAQGLSGVELDYAVLRKETAIALEKGLWRPFLSANDRSRWCTVRALVEPEMQVPGAPYAIDKVTDAHVVNNKLKMAPGWDTIDMVWHNGHYYSSKPPLLSTLMAAEYWIIYHATGKTLGTHPYEIGRFMLITINGSCLLLLFFFTARLIERLGTTDWGRILMMASCVFGTLLTPFAVTITNHLPAAACTAVLADCLLRIWFDRDRGNWTFVMAGGFCALLVAMEIPAGILGVMVSLIVLCLAPRKTLLAYVPPALLVTAAFFGTNWIAVQSLKPVQMHRSGDDNWYDYPGSYWKQGQGIDQPEKSVAVYAFHVLVGHHGIFSLTPIWLLSLLGAAIWLFRGEWRLKLLSLLSLGVTVACVVFYLAAKEVDHNYGGNASGFRWVFWLAPLWLMLGLPAADLLSRRRWSRGLGLVLLALSVMSASYPTWNPWSSPWIMNLMGYLGWL